MDAISDQEVLDLLFPELETKDLLHLCSTDRRFFSLCQNDSFWKQRAQKEYPEIVNQKDPNESWKDFYIYLYSSWKVGVIYDSKLKEVVNLSPGNLLSTIQGLKDEYIEGEDEYIVRPCVVCLDDQLNPIIAFDVEDSVGINFGRPITDITHIFVLEEYPISSLNWDPPGEIGDLIRVTPEGVTYSVDSLILYVQDRYIITYNYNTLYLNQLSYDQLSQLAVRSNIQLKPKYTSQALIKLIVQEYQNQYLFFQLEEVPDWLRYAMEDQMSVYLLIKSRT